MGSITGKNKEGEKYLQFIHSLGTNNFGVLRLNDPLELLDKLDWLPHPDLYNNG
jgi:hypothetical protein